MPEEVDLTASELGFEPTALNDEPVIGEEGPTEGATGESAEAEPAQADTQETGGADAGAEQDSEGAESKAAVPEGTQESTDGSVEAGFVFRGKQYPDQKTAEEAVGSWEGRLSAADRRLNEYYGYVEEVKAQNDRLNAENENLRAGKVVPKPEGGVKEPDKPKSFAESLDWESLAKIKEYAESKGYDPTMVTMRAMAEHWEKYMGTAMEDKLSGINETLEQEKAAKDWNRMEEEVFDWAASATMPDGKTLAFPELNKDNENFSPEFVRLMYSTWNELARENPAFGISPQALDYAYRLTRDLATQLMEEAQTGADTKTGGGATIAEGEQLRAQRNADAETTGSTGAHGGANPLGTPRPKDGTDLLKKWDEIQNVVVEGHDLGFS